MDSGWRVAIFHRRQSDGIDSAPRAARCALAIKALLPEAPVALVGRTARLPRIQQMIDYGVEVLLKESMQSLFSPVMEQSPVMGIRIDDALIPQIEAHYKLYHSKDATYLVAERTHAGDANHR
jgi:hypothetical protein